MFCSKLIRYRFQNTVDSLTARIVLAREDSERARTLLKSRNISQRDADAAFTRFENLSGQLLTAEFELDMTTVRAPTDGYVIQVALRPGMRAASLPLRPVMIFLHNEHDLFIGWFRQNSLLRLTEGNEAEVAFDGIPGRVFSGKVRAMMPALSEGQIQPGGELIRPTAAPFPGRIAVIIDITDPEFEEFRGESTWWCLRTGCNIFGAFSSRSNHAQNSAAHVSLDELPLPIPLIPGLTRNPFPGPGSDPESVSRHPGSDSERRGSGWPGWARDGRVEFGMAGLGSGWPGWARDGRVEFGMVCF